MVGIVYMKETYIGQIIHDAKQLGALDPATIWAFVSIALVAYVFFENRRRYKSNDAWQEIRLQEAKADTVMAGAVQKMAGELAELKVIVSERIPRRN